MHSIRDLQNTWKITGNNKEKKKCIHYIIRDFNEVPSATDKTSRRKPARVENRAVLCFVAQPSPTLYYPVNCNPPAPLSMGFSRQEYWSVLLQGIFPSQGSNPGLPHCRQILYHLRNQGRPWILEWVAFHFSRGFSQPQNWTRVSCMAGRSFTSWATREAQRIMKNHYQPSKLNCPLQNSVLKYRVFTLSYMD